MADAGRLFGPPERPPYNPGRQDWGPVESRSEWRGDPSAPVTATQVWLDETLAINQTRLELEQEWYKQSGSGIRRLQSAVDRLADTQEKIARQNERLLEVLARIAGSSVTGGSAEKNDDNSDEGSEGEGGRGSVAPAEEQDEKEGSASESESESDEEPVEEMSAKMAGKRRAEPSPEADSSDEDSSEHGVGPVRKKAKKN